MGAQFMNLVGENSGWVNSRSKERRNWSRHLTGLSRLIHVPTEEAFRLVVAERFRSD